MSSSLALTVILTLTGLLVVNWNHVEGYSCGPSPAVNGNYSEWEEASECTVTCGGGTKILERTCTNPPPSNCGKNCSDLGPTVKAVPCHEEECRE